MLPKPLIVVDDISYHVLTPEYGDTASAVIARAFCTMPVSQSLVGTQYEAGFMEWMKFMNYWTEHCASNSMSVMAMDRANCKMAGALTVKQLSYTSDQFDQYAADETIALAPLISLLTNLDNAAAEKDPRLKDTDKVVDFWCLAVLPEHRGKKIANNLIRAALMLQEATDNTYATIEAFNHFTLRSAERNGFESVHNIAAKDFLWKGAPIYTSIKEPHGDVTFMVKNLK